MIGSPRGLLAAGLAFCLTAFLACRPRIESHSFVEPVSKRAYRVLEPTGRDRTRSVPVLFALHAFATPPEVLPDSYSLAKKAGEERGFLVIVPEGTTDVDGNRFWNASRACCGNTNREVDDVAYLHGVLLDLKKNYVIDPARVYALGVSNGAFMAHRWACESADLAGIAAVSGVGPGEDDQACRPGRRVRVMQIHGDRDEIIHYEGGRGTRGRYPSALESSRRWADWNGCRVRSAAEENFSVLHGTTRKEAWVDSKPCVLLWTFEGGVHALRSVRFAVPEIVDFLDR